MTSESGREPQESNDVVWSGRIVEIDDNSEEEDSKFVLITNIEDVTSEATEKSSDNKVVFEVEYEPEIQTDDSNQSNEHQDSENDDDENDFIPATTSPPLFFLPLKKSKSECTDSKGRGIKEHRSERRLTGLSPCPTGVTPRLVTPQLDEETDDQAKMWLLSTEVDELVDKLMEAVSTIYKEQMKPMEMKRTKMRERFQRTFKQYCHLNFYKQLYVGRLLEITGINARKMSRHIEVWKDRTEVLGELLVSKLDMEEDEESCGILEEALHQLYLAMNNIGSTEEAIEKQMQKARDAKSESEREKERIENEPSIDRELTNKQIRHLKQILTFREYMREIGQQIEPSMENMDLALIQNWAQMRRADMKMYLEEKNIRNIISDPNRTTFGPNRFEIIHDVEFLEKSSSANAPKPKMSSKRCNRMRTTM